MVSDRTRHVAIGAAVVVAVDLLWVVAMMGPPGAFYLEPVRTYGPLAYLYFVASGSLGGLVAGYRHERGIRGGAISGAVAAFAGGLLSAVVGLAVGSVEFVLFLRDSWSSFEGFFLFMLFMTAFTLGLTTFGGGLGGKLGSALGESLAGEGSGQSEPKAHQNRDPARDEDEEWAPADADPEWQRVE